MVTTALATAAALAGAEVAAAGTAQAAIVPLAGTVDVRFGNWLVYNAGTAVANQISVKSTEEPVVVLHDRTATVTIGASARPYCAQEGAFGVRCRGLKQVFVNLGDGNDRFEYGGYSLLSVTGGDGDDKLHSVVSKGTTRFHGGPGTDSCTGEIDVKVDCES